MSPLYDVCWEDNGEFIMRAGLPIIEYVFKLRLEMMARIRRETEAGGECDIYVGFIDVLWPLTDARAITIKEAA